MLLSSSQSFKRVEYTAMPAFLPSSERHSYAVRTKHQPPPPLLASYQYSEHGTPPPPVPGVDRPGRPRCPPTPTTRVRLPLSTLLIFPSAPSKKKNSKGPLTACRGWNGGRLGDTCGLGEGATYVKDFFAQRLVLISVSLRRMMDDSTLLFRVPAPVIGEAW